MKKRQIIFILFTIGIILFVIGHNFVTRTEYSVIFVPIKKQNGIIYANETELQYWVYTNYTTKEGYFSNWTAINVEESWIPQHFYDDIGLGNVTRIVSFYNIFGVLIRQELQFFY